MTSIKNALDAALDQLANKENPRLPMRPLSERNAEIAEISIRNMEELLHSGLKIIQLQQKTISQLVEDVAMLKNALNIDRAKLVGLGPSVKE